MLQDAELNKRLEEMGEYEALAIKWMHEWKLIMTEARGMFQLPFLHFTCCQEHVSGFRHDCLPFLLPLSEAISR